MLVIAMPDSARAHKMIETARMLNPQIDIIVRTHSDEEAELLRRDMPGKVFMGEHELALGMARYVIDHMTPAHADAAEPKSAA